MSERIGRSIAMVVALVGVMAATGRGQPSSAELDAYLSARQRVIEDRSRPMEVRERTALESAAALDRSAGRASTASEARNRWSRAARLLEDFNRREPDHPEGAAFTAQAAVYRWAIGRSWADRFATNPSDLEAQREAVLALDDAIAALRPIADPEQDDPRAPNFRYRLAQALADRASLEPESSEARRAFQERALEALDKPGEDSSLEGYAQLLRADLLTGLGRFEDAEKALDAADRSNAPPGLADRVAIRVASRLGEGRFDDARAAISQLPDDSRDVREVLGLEVALARWKASPDPEARRGAEVEAFRHVQRLRQDTEGATARRALLNLARVVREPDPRRSPDQCALLAEGALALGELERASRLYQAGADRASESGDSGQAATLRLSAGSALFRAGQFESAERVFGELAQDDQVGPVRPRAALLRALAIGRARSRRASDFDPNRYLEALAAVTREFPGTPEAGESLWLLGLGRREAGDLAGAAAAWKAVPRSHARWLASRLALASLDRDEAERLVGDGDPAAVERALRKAREALEAIDSALTVEDQGGRNEVALARADLETLPEVGDPARALAILDRLLAGPLDEARRARARRLRVMALSGLGRYLEAESAARSLLETQDADAMLGLAARLDRAAVSAGSDLARRRSGELLRLIAGSLREHPEKLSEAESAEAHLRQARSEVFRGDPPAARAALREWPRATQDLPPRLWPALADLAIEASDFERALLIYRRIGKSQPVGSADWFRARYGEALALERSGSRDLARHLIDATAALHPELGGGPIQARFEALREQLDRP